MSLLKNIQRGKKQKPPRVLIYGTPGIGKSTFAASAPDPIFIQTEDGLDEIECTRFPMAHSYDDVMEQLKTLEHEEHDFQTVAVDSLDWLERLIHDKVCRDWNVTGIERAAGGYGKGYTEAVSHWRKVTTTLDRLRNERGMVVVLVAHAKVEKFEDPEGPAYDRYSPRLHKHAADLFNEWADAVVFATRKIRIAEDESSKKSRVVAKGVGKHGGERILRTVGGPACIAKNRYGITEELNLDWGEFASAVAESQTQQPNRNGVIPWQT